MPALRLDGGTVLTERQRYLDLGSIRELVAALAHAGAGPEIAIRTLTARRGGVPFARGTLLPLLKNHIHRDAVVHKG